MLSLLKGWNPFHLKAEIESLLLRLKLAARVLNKVYASGSLHPDTRLEVAKAILALEPEMAQPVLREQEDAFEALFHGPMILVMAQACADEMDHFGAENYVEHTLFSRKYGALTFTIQRKLGVTPGETAQELRQELAKCHMAIDLAIASIEIGSTEEALATLKGVPRG